MVGAEHRVNNGLQALNEALLRHARGQGPRLRELLAQLVQLACELTGAVYGALGVLHRDGSSLKDFVHMGVGEDQARAIGHLPEGKGLLGAVIREGRAIRVSDIARDPRSAGFPPHHPAMTSFLGVPLRIGQDVFGNFYLANKRGGGGFTEEDAGLLEKFSAQAALTVAYARQTEEEERRIFQALVEHAPHGIVYLPDDPGCAVFGNPAAERMLGRVTRANDPARTFDLCHPDGRPIPEDELPSTRALRDEAVINLEVVIRRRSGPVLPALLSAAPVRSEAGVKLGAVVIYEDITTLKEFENLRVQFMAIVAHDLRTPLQSLLLQIESLLKRTSSGAASVPVSALEAMKRNSQRIDFLIRDLLDASRIDAKRVVLHRKTVSVLDLAAALVGQIQGALGDHPVLLDVCGEPPPVSADPLRLEQILTNLLENAAKYSAEGMPIRIVVAASGEGVALSVEDHGHGIPPEEIPRLFDRYYRTSRAREQRRGLGLGLYIARGLVEAHGGRISIRSSPGLGSTFEVWLPRS